VNAVCEKQTKPDMCSKAIVICLAFIAAGFSSCDISPEEKAARRNSLLQQEQALQNELAEMNKKLLVLNTELLKAREKLKKQQEYKYVNPVAKKEGIQVAFYHVQCIEKKMSGFEVNIKTIKERIRILQTQARDF
jgi:cytochrome c556